MPTEPQKPGHARWMTHWLLAAGIYNLAWGAIAIVAPNWQFRLLGMVVPNYPEFWQCIGMIVGVYGIGYLIAARDPYRHSPIVLVGLLGKVLGPIGFLGAVLRLSGPSNITLAFGMNNLTNDLVWWVPFTLILLGARKHACKEGPGNN